MHCRSRHDHGEWSKDASRKKHKIAAEELEHGIHPGCRQLGGTADQAASREQAK
jgi:hypothetical protein